MNINILYKCCGLKSLMLTTTAKLNNHLRDLIIHCYNLVTKIKKYINSSFLAADFLSPCTVFGTMIYLFLLFVFYSVFISEFYPFIKLNISFSLHISITQLYWNVNLNSITLNP